jgi:hypothetical protein
VRNTKTQIGHGVILPGHGPDLTARNQIEL